MTLRTFLGRLPVTVFKTLNDWQSEFRESNEPIIFKIIYRFIGVYTFVCNPRYIAYLLISNNSVRGKAKL